MRTSSGLFLTIAVVVAIYGDYAKASIIPWGLHADPTAAISLANSVQEANNQAVAQAQVAADAAGVNAQAVVDAVQLSNENAVANAAALAEAQAVANDNAVTQARNAAENAAAINAANVQTAVAAAAGQAAAVDGLAAAAAGQAAAAEGQANALNAALVANAEAAAQALANAHLLHWH